MCVSKAVLKEPMRKKTTGTERRRKEKTMEKETSTIIDGDYKD